MALIDQIFEDIVDTIREPILVLDSDLRVLIASRSFYEFFKVKPEETVGRLLYDLSDQQWDIPKLRELLETILPQQTSFDNFTIEHDFANIGRRIIKLNARQIKRAVGKEQIILLTIEDITEHKRLEDLLTESEDRYRRLFETADDGILLLEKSELQIRHANPAVTAMLGYSNDECVGKDLKNIGFPDDIGTFKEIMQTLNKDGIIHFKDTPIKKKSGQVIDTDIYAVDKASLIQCNIRDITEHKKADRALLDSRNMLKTVLDSIPSAVFWKDRDSIYLGGNKTWLEAAGINSVEELVGKSDYDLPWTKEQADSFREHDRLVMESGISEYDIFESYLRADGTLAWARTSKVPLRDTSDKVTGVLGTYEDITERKRVEDALSKSQKMLSRTESIANIGSWEWEIATDTVTWSEELFRIFQLDPDDGTPSWAEHHKLYHPEDFEVLRQAVERAVKDRTSYELEIRAFRKDGETRVCQASGFPETGKDGKVVRLFGSLQDITKRMLTEKELGKSQERMDAIRRSITDIIMTLNEKGRYLDILSGEEELLYGKEQKIIGRFLSDVVPKDIADAGLAAIRQALKTGKTQMIKYQLAVPAGERWFEGKISPVRSAEGGEKLVVMVARDVTERIKLEEELLRSQKLESVGLLAGGIAHDFNNILTTILGNISLAKMQVKPDDELFDLLKEAETASIRAQTLTKQLLTFSKGGFSDKGNRLNHKSYQGIIFLCAAGLKIHMRVFHIGRSLAG